MAMRYLSSSFSLQMLPSGGEVRITKLSPEQFKGELVEESVVDSGYKFGIPNPRVSVFHHWDKAVVGHEGTAVALGKLLKANIPVSREAITLEVGDILFVAQPTGRRLAPGEEVPIPDLSFFKIEVRDFSGQIQALEKERRELSDQIWKLTEGEPVSSPSPYDPEKAVEAMKRALGW
jgi:hypothetical protein